MKEKFKNLSKTEKTKFEVEYRKVVLAALSASDWSAIYDQEIEKFGSPGQKIEYRKFWDKLGYGEKIGVRDFETVEVHTEEKEIPESREENKNYQFHSFFTK